jgi:serine/threonine protein kinase
MCAVCVRHRFRREAHVLAGLQHEHIARIIDRQDPEVGPRFHVTDYIDGIDLSALRRRGPVPAAVVVQLGLQASAALAYAHTAGVIHRDIKPSNMMLVRHPGGDVFVRVIDFGIAKLTRGSDLAAPNQAPAGARRETRGDVVVGTAPYWCGHEGPRRDVYALALTLAELLTGEPPDASVDLAREHIPLALARCITAALRSDEIITMDALHTALREAEAQAPGDVEPERRRYVARILSSTQAAGVDRASDVVPRFAERYIFAGDLGQGGMGRVRTSFDTVHQRLVALKTIHPRYAGMKNLEHRFRREARALAAIRHGGAPTLFDGGHEPEPYFTMEIVEGVTLAAALRQSKKIEPPRALSLAIDLAGILCAAHDVGVIHRDVKPDNIVIEQGDRVRLLDFGACLLMPRFHQRHLLFPATPTDERYATGDLEMVGTPGYTAPEVMDLQGGGAGPRSDVYSVCAVLYEMLTGRRFADPAAGRTRRLERGEFAAALGPMADLLRSGTAREPGDRVWNMSELVRRLEIIRANFLRAQQRRKLALAVTLAIGSTAAIGAVAVRSYVDARTVSSAASIPATDSPAQAPPLAGPAQSVNHTPWSL